MALADARQRQQALDITQSHIVQAPAGSGKTGVLTLRILKLLSVVDRPEQILAITFTKKAAAEMRLRVMEALQLASRPTPPNTPYERQFYDLATSVLERDKAQRWGLMQNLNRLRLLTIDSFCNTIVRHRPLSSGLGVQFNITEDPRQLYSEASHALLESLDEEGELSQALLRVLGYLNNQYNQLEDLISQMLANRDHWLGDITRITQLHGNIAGLKTLLEHSLDNLNQQAYENFYAQFDPDFRSELNNLSEYAIQNLQQTDPTHGALQFFSNDLEQQKQRLKLFLKKDLEPRVSFDKRCGFPPGTNAEEKKVAKEYKSRAKALIDRIVATGEPGIAKLLDFLQLPGADIKAENWQLLEDLILVVRYAAAHLKLVFQQQHSVDFTEIALAALAALGEAQEPSDLTLILDESIAHILVDEFQDTSFVQVELLERLTTGWTQGDGRSLFLVGDPMQSIYAFRKADVGLFLQLWEQQQLGDIHLTPLQLCTNFRSSERVINWVNHYFSRCFPAQRDIRKGAVTYAPSNSANDNDENDGVTCQLFFQNEEASQSPEHAEACWVAEQIQCLPESYSIAILVKGKSHILHITKALRDRCLPYQAVEMESMADSQIIIDLLSVIKAYHSPSNKTAWFGLLRGPWCGLTLAELQTLADINSHPWIALTQATEHGWARDRFSLETQDKLHYIQQLFQHAYQNRHGREWVTAIRDLALALGIPATARSAREVEAIERLFELAANTPCIGDIPDVSQLEKRLNELFVPTIPTESNTRCIQIITMHKSKGLEFDAVFLPQLHRQGRSDDKPLILVDKQTAQSRQDQELFVAPLERANEKAAEAPTVYQYLWQLNKQRKRNEQARLLYVACTRAKKQLFLTGCLKAETEDSFKKPDPNSLLSLLWGNLEQDQATRFEQATGNIESMSDPYFRRPSSDFYRALLGKQKNTQSFIEVQGSPISSPSGSADQDAANVQENESYQRLAGIMVHQYLETFAHQPSLLAGFKPEHYSDKWQRKLIQLGLSASQAMQGATLIEKALQQVLKSSHRHWLFEADYDEHYAEYSLVYHQGTARQLTIDRLFTLEDTRYIVDYKLSQPYGDKEAFLEQETKRYREQLRLYSDAINAIAAKPTKTFLYFPLIDHLQEIAV